MASDATAVLSLLGDEHVRCILGATSREALSARALSEECDVAPSTIYRRVDDMLEADLLVERTAPAADGSHHSVYAANVDRVDVAIEDGAIEVTLEEDEDAAKRFTRIWNDIRDQ